MDRLAFIKALVSTGGEVDLDVLLPRVLEILAEATHSDVAGIYLLDADGQSLILSAALGCAPQQKRVVPGELALPGIAQVEMLLPLGHLAGSVFLGRHRDEPYTDADLLWADALAGQAAVQIENARLYAEAQKRLRHLSLLLELTRLGAEERQLSSVLERALDPMLDAFSASYLLVHLISDNRMVLEGVRCPPTDGARKVVEFMSDISLDSKTLAGRAAIDKTTVLMDVERWPQATRALAQALDVRYGASSPLLASDRLVGVISVARTEDRPFSRDDVQMLESCAAHLGAVVEHARLFEEEHRRARDLSLMNDLGAIIAQHLDLSAVLDIGVRHAARIARVPNAFLMLLDEKAETLRVVASTLADQPKIVLSMRGSSLAQRAVLEGKPIVTDDATVDPRASKELAARYAHQAMLAVPLVAEGKPLGALVLGETRVDRRFAPAEIETAVALGNQLATAVANAHLFEDLKRSYEKLEQTQEQLIRQERLAALGELAAVMAHEVRNPLAIIFNAIASLRNIPHPRSEARTLIGIVAEEAEQLNRIVGDLLDFARPHEPIFRAESLEGIVHAALESAKGAERARGIEFIAEIDAMPPVSLDARMFKQALINLIVNAIQALPNGGRIVVRARETEKDGGKVIEVSVIDDGPGIAPELRGHVFQPFFTTKASGTGLGLTIVKRIAETHQGEVTVESTVGVGTTSTLRLSIDRVRPPL